MKVLKARVPAYDADELLAALSERQFIRPHSSIGVALAELATRYSFCDLIPGRALAWLELDGSVAIGRLRRSELSQLSRCIHRFWRQTLHRQSASDVSPVPAV
ncbi:hypothetical protein [Humisphaera borealis]|uniref:Uncharacterized protein n=1 Tax=Humisphaera borealis TaxID=2807512 RepID=A0A7M2X2N4_9BACT|nr:hypothetical protein [Humisphaera borealis]QOV92026.1 hypothetical protein IPV69_12005 [Humisphaera borealis]